MKKLLTILLITYCLYAKAQVGLVLTGQTFNSVDTLAKTTSTLYVVPQICYYSGRYSISLIPAPSPYRAFYTPGFSNEWNVPRDWNITDTTSIRFTRAQELSKSTTYLQGKGFTVTTF